MTNPLEAIWNTLKMSLDHIDEQEAPLHVIEVGDCWKYITILQEFIRYEEISLNTTTDDEVREMLVDIMKLCESQAERLSVFMKQEGIPLPNVTPAKPKSRPNDIPLGVKLSDDEIVNGVSFKLVICMQQCAKGQADAIRFDVGKVWLEFFLEWVTFGATIKTLSRKRGWIKVPPYYYPPGSPN